MAPSRQIVQSVSSGRADIGIVGGTFDAAASEIETLPLSWNRLMLIVPRKHPLAGLRRIDFVAALAHDWVGLKDSSVLQSFLDERARAAGARLKIRVRLATFDALGEMVAHGIGIAVASEVAALRWAKSGRVKLIALTDAWAIRDLTVCARRAALLSGEARELMECLMTDVAPARRSRSQFATLKP